MSLSQKPKLGKTAGFAPIVIIIAIAALALILGGGWYAREKGFFVPLAPGQKACTQEAKLCSDGKTSVDRTGPNCEFQACPASASEQVNRTNPQEVLKEVSWLLKMGDIESAKKYLSGRDKTLSKLNSATADQLFDLSDYFAGAVLVEEIGDIRVYKSFLRAKGTAGGEVTFMMARDNKKEWWINF